MGCIDLQCPRRAQGKANPPNSSRTTRQGVFPISHHLPSELQTLHQPVWEGKRCSGAGGRILEQEGGPGNIFD